MVRAALRGAEVADLRDLERAVDPRYADALGGRPALLSDVRGLARVYPRRTIQALDVRVRRPTTSQAVAEATVDLDLDLGGARPSVRGTGTMRVEVVRDGVFRVRSGLLTEVRDALQLLRSYRSAIEGNDVAALGRLLHPNYRDARLDRVRLLEAIAPKINARAIRFEPVAQRIELRPGLVHVDLHLRMAVDDRPPRPHIARLTLSTSAGKLRIRAGVDLDFDPTP